MTVLLLSTTVIASASTADALTADALSAPMASIKAEIEGEPTSSQSQALQKLGVSQDVAPVAGAEITISSLGLVATTDSTGKARIDGIPVSADLTNVTRLDIVVSAPGYAKFTHLSTPVSPAGGDPYACVEPVCTS